MRYTHSINAVKCQEWGLNLAQGALFDLINQASSWAKPHVIDNEIYYWMSRNKVISEIPVAYTKTDTVYRAFKLLAEKELIHYVKEGKKDLVKMTEKGKSWNVAGTIQGDAKLGNKSELHQNSEINPTNFGNKSELPPDNAEINPTYKNTTNKSTTNKKNYVPEKPETVSGQIWDDLLILRKETKASNSQTAWTTVFNALDKAQQKTGHSLDDVITFWIGRAWKGFNADWYIKAHSQPQQTNYQGSTYENRQSVNHSNQQHTSQQFDTSTSSGYAAKLDADAAAYFASINTEREVNPVSQEFVSEMESLVQGENENPWG